MLTIYLFLQIFVLDAHHLAGVQELLVFGECIRFEDDVTEVLGATIEFDLVWGVFGYARNCLLELVEVNAVTLGSFLISASTSLLR